MESCQSYYSFGQRLAGLIGDCCITEGGIVTPPGLWIAHGTWAVQWKSFEKVTAKPKTFDELEEEFADDAEWAQTRQGRTEAVSPQAYQLGDTIDTVVELRVFVDDFMNGVAGPPGWASNARELTWISWAVMHGIHSIFPPLK